MTQGASGVKKARVNMVELAYHDQGRSRGERPVVLLVHGYPLNKGMWESQVATLSRRYRVIAPDLRGHGESTAPTGTYTVDLLAEDLKALLDHLGIGESANEVALVGFSMGGYVAFAFYRKYAALLRGLVLVDTRPQPDTPEGKQTRENQAQQVLREGVGGLAQALPGRMLARETVEKRPELVAKVKAMMTSTPVNGYVGDLRGMAERPDSSSTLAEIACPTLIMVGDQDAITPVADSEMMAQKLPRARTAKGILLSHSVAKLVKISGAGHLSPMEQPEAVNRALEEFLREL